MGRHGAVRTCCIKKQNSSGVRQGQGCVFNLFYVYHVYVNVTENVYWQSVEFLLLNKT